MVLTHILAENHHVLQMANSALNVEKLDILENIVYQNNGDKHVNHNQMNTNTHNNVIPEKKFVVCPNINKVTLTKSSSIYTTTPSTKTPEITVKIGEVPVQVIIVTGSSVNILNHEHFKRINQQNPGIQLEPTTMKVFAYGAKQPLHLLGQFTTTIQQPPVSSW